MPRAKTDGDYPRCGRSTIKGTLCTNVAGKGTQHKGRGACHMHGGNDGGAPKGNKNALTHGAYETLYEDLFTPEENAIREGADIVPLSRVRKEIRLLEVRQYRMLRRIKDLEDRIRAGESLETTSTERQCGWNIKGKVDLTISRSESLATRLAGYEAALTQVQARMAAYLTIANQLEKQDPPQDDPLIEFMASMRREQEEWNSEQEDEE